MISNNKINNIMKSEFTITQITKKQAASILDNYHYLKDISKTFKTGVNFGLFYNGSLCGVCIFTGFPVPELAVGIFGLERNDQNGLYELSRLCLHPDIQKSEHNIASWFVSRCIKELKTIENVRAILSYADTGFHTGIVYKACNFKYYGLTKKRSDFYIKQPDGSFVKHSRGKTKGIVGEWRPRSQKHIFCLVYDKKLKIKLTEHP